jgi:FdhD protein
VCAVVSGVTESVAVATAMPGTSRKLTMQRRVKGRWQFADDEVAEEVPIALEYNGVSHAVMLATPADLEDFALGFSLTEDIVTDRSQVRGIELVPGPLGITVQIEIGSAAFATLKDRRRSLAGRTGCGLCGTESLPQAVRMPALLDNSATFDPDAVHRGLRTLATRQPLHARTGATHAAAWCTADGDVVLVREDVGRHNALDKLVGALASADIDAGTGFVVVTSRASYEMAGKTVRCGATLLAAVSGVTGLAVDLAEACGLTLIGFARGESLNLYAHPERLAAQPGDSVSGLLANKL